VPRPSIRRLTAWLVAVATLAAARVPVLRAADDASAPPAPAVEYRLPFPEGASWPVYQGNDQGPTHNTPQDKYAWDFSPLPEGSPVCVSADGVVIGVREDTAGPTGNWADNNYVHVKHADGRVSEYLHLKKDGALVEVGDVVLAGDLIALSGSTGLSEKPHLHYGLQSGPEFGMGTSVASRFADIEADGVPKKGQTVKSGNVAVRDVPGIRQVLDAELVWPLCETLDARAAAIPAMDAARKAASKLRHATIERILGERDALLAARQTAGDAAAAEAKKSFDEGRIEDAARLVVFGQEDWGGLPVQRKFPAFASEFSKNEKWADALKALSAAKKFRKLVADAVKAEVAATARGPAVPRQERNATPAVVRPDYGDTIKAFEAAAAAAPTDEAKAAIAAHVAALRKVR
jgi:murein DD-endopeptidase MepM/ murein hydrolase activator NlpD